MADRNERHFLEFYTPARQRIGRLATRRLANTERQRMQQTTPTTDDKENPTDIGAVPATIPGEKAVGIGRPRRRLFTRSGSKQKFVDDNLGINDDGTGTYSNSVFSSHDLASASLSGFEITSPPGSGTTVSRALFSTAANKTPANENGNSASFFSPPGTSNLLKEYRSKQSLLSSSKTRKSPFSSPISGGLWLRSSPLWKMGKGDKKSEVDQKKNSKDSSSIFAIETSDTLEVSPTGVETTAASYSTSREDLQPETSDSKFDGTTPPSTKRTPATPEATPKSTSFWSPPGTSRLLRKYRQRTHELNQDQLTFQSPPSGESSSNGNYGRSQTTPRGRNGLRLLDSGAKRCRNPRLSLRPRPASNEATTPAKAKIRAKIKTSAKTKETTKTIAINDNCSLLSPSTAKRLNKDIKSYRQANAKKISAQIVAETDSNFPEETKIAKVGDDIEDDSNQVDNESCMDQNDDGGVEMAPYTQFLPALSASDNAEGDTSGSATNDSVNDLLPFDEHNAASPIVNSATQPLPGESSSVQTKAIEDTATTTSTSSPEAVTANPSDEDATESGVFRSTRSATRARRQSMREAIKPATSSDATTDEEKEEHESGGDVRSIRSTSRSLWKSSHDEAKDATSANATPLNSKDGEEEGGGVFRNTRSATRARRKSFHDQAEAANAANSTPANSDHGEDEGSCMFRSSAEAVTENLDNDTGIFRNTRSATRARRISLVDAEKAVTAAEKAITGKSENSLLVDDGANSHSNVDSSALASPLPPQGPNDTPSSKGSLQSIWDALHCVSGENKKDSSPSLDTGRDCNVHASIVSRVGDCVNPMAATLMKMWREEEKAAANQQKELEASQEGTIEDSNNIETDPNTTVFKEDKGGTDSAPFCGLKTPPPKSFSTDLNLVYGLERVQNLTLARPRALQATPTTNAESSPSMGISAKIPEPLASCTQ